MTGPEHYTAAEEALVEANECTAGTDVAGYYLALAHAHAALALAATTALRHANIGEWLDVAGPPSPDGKWTE